MNKKIILVLIIAFSFFAFLILMLFKPEDLKKYEKFTGENEYGKMVIEREEHIFKYNYMASGSISNEHKSGDWYVFDFYTNDNKLVLNCAINVFTVKAENNIHSQINIEEISKLKVCKVVITTKNGKYEMPLSE
jgi:hypothetical protein